MLKKILAILFCLAALPLGSAASTNLIVNGDFENDLSGWGNRYTTNITCNTTAVNVHEGEKSLRFFTETSNIPYVTRTLTGMREGAAYSYGMYVKTEDAGCNMAFKFEWNDSDNKTVLQSGSDAVTENTNGEWSYLSGTEIVPEGADRVVIYVRMYGRGTAYVDDVTFQYAKDPAKFLSFKTDDIFYYSDRTADGVVDITLNTKFHHLQNTPVKMEFRKDSNVLYSKEAVTDDLGKAGFTFPLSWIAEKKTKYTVVCSVEGETVSQNVYMYDRPQFIRKDGVYEENGKVFDPVPIYHVPSTGEDVLNTLKNAGINLVQASATTASLSALEACDMKAIAVLYDGKISAGAENRLETTKNVVRNYRKRSGVFGWAVLDEPDIKPKTLEELEAAYVMIRQYDDNHPVWITANGDFETLAKYCDVLCADVYPYSNTLFTTRTTQGVREAVAAAKGKPVYSLLQAFEYRESRPDATQLRHMIYQSFYAGAKGVGYYCYEKPMDGLDLPKTSLWSAVQSFGKEKETAFRAFAHTKGEILLSDEDANAAWLIKRVDGDLFLLILNKSYEEGLEKSISHTAFSPDMRVVAADGTKSEAVAVQEGSVAVTLQKNEALFVRLTDKDTLIRFVSDKGGALSSLSEGDSIRPYASVWQKDATNPMLILAVYDGNSLVGFFVYSEEILSAAHCTVIGETETVEKGLKYKLMLWNGRTMKPIKNIEFTT